MNSAFFQGRLHGWQMGSSSFFALAEHAWLSLERQPDARVLLSDVGVLDALEGGHSQRFLRVGMF